MSIRSRNKGKVGEREVCVMLRATVARAHVELGLPPVVDIKRNLMQCAEGGYDIEGLPWLAIEVKRQERLEVERWWQQAVAQAERADRLPVLIYRQSRKKWRVVMYGGVQPMSAKNGWSYMEVEIDIEAFLRWLHSQIVEYHHASHQRRSRRTVC